MQYETKKQKFTQINTNESTYSEMTSLTCNSACIEPFFYFYFYGS